MFSPSLVIVFDSDVRSRSHADNAVQDVVMEGKASSCNLLSDDIGVMTSLDFE